MFRKKGQSLLEYALLLGVILVAIMIMQVFVKRGFQGRLKESADSMGPAFSAGGTTTKQESKLEDNQTIREESGTNATAFNYTQLGFNRTVTGTEDKGTTSFTLRTGGTANTTTEEKTEAAKQEKFKWEEFDNTTYSDFNLTQ